MIIAADPRGAVAVTQSEHAAMCAAFADVWADPVEPVVRVAAEQHELHWAEMDSSPPFHPPSGLPASVMDLHFSRYIDGQTAQPRMLAERDPHAALLTSLKHRDLYTRPGPFGVLSPDGRRLRRYFAESERFERSLRERIDASDEIIEREWRLVRTFDGLSHDLLLDRVPCERRNVPDAAGELRTLRLERDDDGAIVVDPWPFAGEEAEIPCHGRLLTEPFADEEAMRAGLAAAPRVTLSYRLRRA